MNENHESSGLKYFLSEKFLGQRERETTRWDKEWLRYFSGEKDYRFYFYDMDTEYYALRVSKNNIAEMSPAEFFDVHLFRDLPARVYVAGDEIVDKHVFEIGCGPGFFGRLASRFVASYTGADLSQFALHLARLTSPKICTYVHLFDSAKMSGFKGKYDLAFGRHFFIHHNYKDSFLLISLLKDLTTASGIISADFHNAPDRIDGARRLNCQDELRPEYPSALFNFEAADIVRLADESGLKILSSERVDEMDIINVRFAKR